MKTTKHGVLALALALAATLATAACSGNGGGGTPTATPTPFTPTNCQISWLTASSASGATYNAYVVDMPISAWTTGTKSFSAAPGGNEGTFYYRLDLQLATAAAVGLATNGSFDVTVAGTAAGNAVTFSDAAGQAYFDAANPVVGGQIATNGTGTFDGEWSDPDPAASPTYGSGTVHVLFQGSNLELGTDAAFGFCYDAAAFVPLSHDQRALQFLSRLAE